MRLERFWRGQALRIGGGQIDDQAHDGLPGEIAVSDAEAADFDEPGQFAHGADHELPVAGFKMDAIIADQHGRR